MTRSKILVSCGALLLACLGFATSRPVQSGKPVTAQENKLLDKFDPDILASAHKMLRDGRQTFRSPLGLDRDAMVGPTATST